MPEIVIVEGPDGSGKSTLIEEYFVPQGYEVIHNGVYDSPLDAYTAYMSQLSVIEDDDKIVFDRMHISQDIYGPIYRGEDRLPEMHAELDKILFSMEAVVVLCFSVKTIPNWLARKELEDEYVTEYLPFLKIVNEYHPHSFDKHTALPYMPYDYVDADKQLPISERIKICKGAYRVED